MTPNLFLIGAPKCGTSSLFDWLTQHPEVAGTSQKEPFALVDPAHPLARRPNLHRDGVEAYDGLFGPQGSAATFRMEGTTHYLFDPVARAEIAGMPESRVVVVLREPAARVYSSYRYTANNLARLSPNLTFNRYLELIDRGEALAPTWCRDAGSAFVLEHDVDYSRYFKHLAPWCDLMGPDRLRIMLMEDVIEDPQGSVAELFTWLGLDPSPAGHVEIDRRNRTEEVRAPRLQAVARWMNARFPVGDGVREVLKRSYATVQYRKADAMRAEDEAALEALRTSYAEDNATLSRLTGLNLAPWYHEKPMPGLDVGKGQDT